MPGLTTDEWGGDTMVVPVSAKQGTGLPDLLEAIVLTADSTEIKANPKGKVLGTVIEAELDRTAGVVATLLVQNGTLRVGDVVIAGKALGNVRAMFDFHGQTDPAGAPSTPVSVLGLSDVPKAGELFTLAASEKEAACAGGRARKPGRSCRRSKSRCPDPGAGLRGLPGREGPGAAPDRQGRRPGLARADRLLPVQA